MAIEQALVRRSWSFSTAGRIHFGWGALDELRHVGEEFGSRVLICTDQNLVASGIVERAEGLLREGGARVQVFSDGRAEVDLATIYAAVESAREFSPDVIVGVGGGSNLDLGKCVAILLRHEGPLSRYYGEDAVPGRVVSLVAIPTTAGTGSEVSPVAVVSDPERSMKVGIASRRILPQWALVDPSLTISCPPRVTAHSGMDALSHAIEAFCARIQERRSREAIFVGKNPLSDSLAREAIQLIARSLERAVTEPDNREAREDMAMGSLFAGMAFANAGTATTHALQYPVGEATHTSHGLGNAVLMPAVLNAIAVSRIPEMAFVARSLDPGLDAMSDESAAHLAPALVASLGERIDIPRGLRTIGIVPEQLPEIAHLAFGVKRLLDNSPVSFGEEDLLRILEEAY